MEKKKGKQKMKPLKDELELVQIRLVPEKTLYSTEKLIHRGRQLIYWQMKLEIWTKKFFVY